MVPPVLVWKYPLGQSRIKGTNSDFPQILKTSFARILETERMVREFKELRAVSLPLQAIVRLTSVAYVPTEHAGKFEKKGVRNRRGSGESFS